MSGWRGRQSARSESSSLLDRRTNSGRKHETPTTERVLTLRDYSKVGVLEFGMARVQLGKERKEPDGETNKVENKLRAVRRARANVRRSCLDIEAAYILTLTYHENMQDREHAIVDRQEFDRLMRKQYNNWSYVAVAEQQKRGAWHWHIATRFQVDQEVALKAWRQVTGDQTITQVNNGFKPDGKGNAYGKCSGYISKYIGKGLEEGEHFKHSYHVCRGSAVEVQRFSIPMNANKNTETLMMLELTAHFLGLEVSMWVAPMPAGSSFGFVRCERRELQPCEKKGGV